MDNLRVLREERKLSQQKLAIEFDLARSQIQYYEKGTYEPDIITLNKYADFLMYLWISCSAGQISGTKRSR